jgi:putative phosphoribosyl transferase
MLTPRSQKGGTMNRVFRDRVDAGRRLADRLAGMRAEMRAELGADLCEENVVVLGLPRGGVPVAAEVASVLGVPLDVIVVRKLGVPFQPEVAFGAIGEDGERLLDYDLIAWAGITPSQIFSVEQRERSALNARVALFRAGRERLDLTGQTAIIVDDGIATGASASAACRVARSWGAAHVIVAAPVGGPDAARRVQGADEVICLIQPPDFQAVGAHYQDFGQTSDAEVVELLTRALDCGGKGSR